MNAMQLMEAFDALTEAEIARELTYQKPPIRHTGRRLAAVGGMAACIAAVAGTAFLLHDDGLTQQSSNLDAVMLTADAEPAQTAADQPKAETAPAETAPPEDTPAVPAQTETAVLTEYAETAPSEAEPAPTETMLTETVPSSVVYELGDVDMDGKITYVDAALVMVDYWLAKEGRLDESLINEEQRVLGNVNGLDDGELLDPENPFSEYVDPETGEIHSSIIINNYQPFALSSEDYRIIWNVARLRNWYGADVSVSDFLAKEPQYWDEYLANHEAYRTDWAEADELLHEMGLALTAYEPIHPDRIENGEHGDLKYTVEDFRRMTEEMLKYFDDIEKGG